MASEDGVRERFEAEARSAARLSHPNVVQVFDSGEHDGIPYLVMELLPGRTLADEVAQGSLDPEVVRRIGIEVLGALEERRAWRESCTGTSNRATCCRPPTAGPRSVTSASPRAPRG